MLRTSTTEYLAAEPLGAGAVEDAVGLEAAEDVGIQHLGPFVSVVAASVTAAEDMAEIGGGAASRHAWQQVGHRGSLHLFGFPDGQAVGHSMEGYVRHA